MSFSQSFQLGDDTLRELERGFIKTTPKLNSNNNNLITPPCKRKHNNNNNSDEKNHHNRSDLEDIIEDSPTDKSNLTCKSIKERLRNSSRSSVKKHMRRSKSDPVAANQSNHSKQTAAQTERMEVDDFGSMFDSTMEMEPHVKESKQNNKAKPNGLLQPANGNGTKSTMNKKTEKIPFSESIDKYFQESLDCFTQMRELEKENQVPTDATQVIAPVASPGLSSQFFQSQFSMEAANSKMSVSDIENMLSSQRSLMQAINDTSVSETNKTSEDLFNGVVDEEVVLAHTSFVETDDIALGTSSERHFNDQNTEDMSNIYWDESDFFSGADVADGNRNDQMAVNQSLNENIVDDGSISSVMEDLNGPIAGFIDEEIEICRLDVSSALLTEVTQSQMVNRSNRVNNSSVAIDRSVQSSAINMRSQRPKITISGSACADIRDINNLSKWGFSRIILEEYKKKNIHKMFDWQAECLRNEKLWKDARNLVYSAPTSAGKTFVSEILMIRNVIERQKKVLVILPFISVVREKMYYLQVT